MTVPNLNPLGYVGIKEKNPPNIRYFHKDPTALDISGFDIGDIWINTDTPTSWQLMGKAGGIANWITIGGGTTQISTLTGDVGGAVAPVAGNVNINGVAAQGVSTSNGGAGILSVTVQDATTAVKGVSSFSSTYFSTAAGVVSLKGGLVLLLNQDIVNQPVVSFLTPTFRNFVLVISDVVPATDGESLSMQMSNDAGVTWVVAGYESGVLVNDYDSAVLANNNSATEFVISGDVDNGAATSTLSGSINIYGANIGNLPRITGSTTYTRDSSSKTAFCQLAGTGGSTGLNAIKLFFTAGNIASGRFTLFGVKDV